MESAVRLTLAGGPDRVDPGWQHDAPCRNDDPDLYYPTRSSRAGKGLLERCREHCAVQAQCLSAALTIGEHHGIWGGTTAAGRRRLRAVLRDGGVLGLVGEDGHIAWQEPGADREPSHPAAGRRRPATPWPHQTAAVEAIVQAIPQHGSCQISVATGAGKTLIAAWAAARLEARRVLVLVPNLALVAQTAEAWARTEPWQNVRAVAVCSDSGELPLTTTTDPGEVRATVNQPGPVLVFATYQSSGVLVDAGCRFDLAVADEAHHLAGAATKPFAAIARREIVADRTLYMTATPRRLTRKKRDVELVSMHDTDGSFGPRVFDFPLSDAIAAGVVADYRVIVAAVEREVFDRVAAHPELAGLDPHLLAGAIAVVRAMGEFGLSSCVSFHNRVDRARTFAQLVGSVADAVPALRPSGPGWSGWVQGSSSVRIRRRLLARLADPTSWGVLANAKALGEGVDVPDLDAVAIVDPKNSETDVLQATGRALRRGNGSKVGTVILPVLLTTEASVEDPLAGADERSLQLVGGVLRALRAHDSDLGARLDSARRAVARTSSASVGLAGLLGRNAAQRLVRSRVELWVPGGATGTLASAMALRLIREATPSWEEAYGRLLAWLDEHGTARVPQTARVPADNAGDTFALGAWCTAQRGQHRRGLLGADRVQRLEALTGWEWEPRHVEWWSTFDALADYLEVHGGYPTQRTLWQDRKLGVFINEVRTAYNNDGWITRMPDRVAALEALPGWAWNQRHADWERHFADLARWAQAHGHACPSSGDLVDGFDIARWTTKQRSKIRAGALDPDRVARLRALPGWVDNTTDALWEEGFWRLVAWHDSNGTVPSQQKVLDDGFQLGAWVASQRQRWRQGRLNETRIRRLEALDSWTWTPVAGIWDEAYARLVAFASAHGSVSRLPAGVVDGVDLAAWATTQRVAHGRGELSGRRVAALERIPGWVWSVHDARFDAALTALRSYIEREGHGAPPTAHREHGVQLAAWISRVRREHSRGDLTADRVAQLEAVPHWTWQPPVPAAARWAQAWDAAYQRLVVWTAAAGHAAPSTHILAEDGFRIGAWVVKQRSRYHQGKLDPERAERLADLPGWVWSARGDVTPCQGNAGGKAAS